ncbi:cobalt-precorrin-6A reductase [Mycolicibacterium psychrotolerans]|uniref:cobalt-precorrin-6A reductase n=1 Tax=Mycolicibacterium psychrotolerans TaxID=216929 RepID=UPI003D665064
MRILLLGGTGEARALAARLHPHRDIVSSLAGRVPDPALPVGPVRIGGFGGVDGLRQWLRANDIGAVIDATHPFAATMTAHAARACAELHLPHLVLSRPAWDPAGAVQVASDVDAADVIVERGFSRVFLTTGRSGVRPFTGSDAWFLIRVVTPPDADVLPRNHEVVLSRGPYGYDDECALLRDNRIDVLVTKNSGGELTEAKLAAAKDLGVTVVMIDRPPLPAGVTAVGTVDEAEAWVTELNSPAEQAN